MSRDVVLARRYGRALFEVASAQDGPVADTLRTELETLVGLIARHVELRTRLDDPAVGNETKARLLGAIVQKAGGSPLVGRLLGLLARHARLALLPEIASSYALALNAARGVVQATAISALPLDEPQKTALAKALCEAVGKRIELESQVDPALVGGVLVRVGGRTYDGSVRSRLLALRRRLVADS